MTQNEHVYEICCRLEVADDVISGENVKTVEGQAVLNFEVASLVCLLFSSEDNPCPRPCPWGLVKKITTSQAKRLRRIARCNIPRNPWFSACRLCIVLMK